MPRPNAKRRFGQHFLEPPWVVKLVRAMAPHPDETFVEIGPGRGVLTRPLAAAAAHVLAFEIDRDLIGDLRTNSPPNVTVVEGDFLDVGTEALQAALTSAGHPGAAGRLRVAGNLPYNVATAILFKLGALYAEGVPFVDATVMLQREVAERLLAPAGTREYGVLSVLIRHWADVERVFQLPPGAFRPSPKVHSTVVRLRFHEPRPRPRDPRVFRTMTEAIFTRRRKTLANALLAYAPSTAHDRGLALGRAGIDGRRRPETLEIEELVRLADVLSASAGS